MGGVPGSGPARQPGTAGRRPTHFSTSATQLTLSNLGSLSLMAITCKVTVSKEWVVRAWVQAWGCPQGTTWRVLLPRSTPRPPAHPRQHQAAPHAHLPVQLAVVDHGVHAHRLDAVHAPHLELGVANLHDVDGVVVALGAGGTQGGRQVGCGRVSVGCGANFVCWGGRACSDGSPSPPFAFAAPPPLPRPRTATPSRSARLCAGSSHVWGRNP